MKIRVLGCGSSFGVPLIGNKFGNCDSNNSKNYRTRPSILINSNDKNILIDSGPDLRFQLLQANIEKIDACLYTHKHADHIHGINDLRALSLFMKKKIPAWGSEETIDYLINNFNYIFKKTQIYEPIMDTNIIADTFYIDDIKINSFQHNHGKIDCTSYRINDFAYSTDIKYFYDNTLDKLKGIKLWIIGCLRMDSHPSHASYDQIMEYINYIKPEKTYLTHLTGLMDYETLINITPENINPAYDGLELNI
ncbi:MAG: Ribonuclease BN [Alphaproteobacteria bacterium MarineAlpha5_Bin11]|nr:MBL fold metallo-hydrolase [Pelagibacteraceae bacterium]PPR43030.1 MAG: Ribonuclease BN [Alphaproteobacteria bacterium MarineAlpha5_Bin11]|tara:strand:+ start:851 stop:1603 length:753 start_codon:yes stop_codon:yes gene_type:complete